MIPVSARKAIPSSDRAELPRSCPQSRGIAVRYSKKRQAFQELDAARAQIKMYLPDDFDPDKELEEARAERYGSLG